VKKKYQYIVLFILGMVAVWYASTRGELFQNLKRVSALSLVLLFAFVFVTHLVTGYRFKLLMQVFSIRLDFKEWYGVSVCNVMFNYYLPARGGLAVRAYYLKKKYAFAYSHYTSLVAGSQIISFFLSAVAGLGFTLLFRAAHGIWLSKFMAVFASLLGVTAVGTLVLLVLLKLGKTFDNARFNNILRLFREGLSLFGKNKKLVAAFCVFHILGIVAVGARLFV